MYSVRSVSKLEFQRIRIFRALLSRERGVCCRCYIARLVSSYHARCFALAFFLHIYDLFVNNTVKFEVRDYICGIVRLYFSVF